MDGKMVMMTMIMMAMSKGGEFAMLTLRDTSGPLILLAGTECVPNFVRE
jgi:hypothetical protein